MNKPDPLPSPFEWWKSPCQIDWSLKSMTDNKFAGKAPRNPKPPASPWKDVPMVEKKKKRGRNTKGVKNDV